MRIFFGASFFGGFYGGGSVSFKLLSKALEEKKHEIYIITTRKTTNSTLNIISLPHAAHIPGKLIKLGNNFLDYLLASSFKKIFHNNNPDLLHVQDEFILPASVYVAKELCIPVVATMRSNAHLHPPLAESLPLGVRWLIRRQIHKTIKYLKKVDAIITVSDYIKKELIEVGIPKENITVIYNLPPNWKPIDFRKTTSDRVTLLTSGRLCKYKGFETLVKSVSLVVRKYEDIRVIIAGRGPYLKQLKRLISHLNLTDCIKLVGMIPYNKIKKLYFNSDIIVLMSRHPEPFSRVLLEAMAAGKPIIATNTGGTPEAVVHMVNGLLVPPNDPKKTATAIIKLIEDPDLRKHMGTSGRKILQEKFNPNTIINKTIKLYESVISLQSKTVFCI